MSLQEDNHENYASSLTIADIILEKYQLQLPAHFNLGMD